jgi:hypothetical protein
MVLVERTPLKGDCRTRLHSGLALMLRAETSANPRYQVNGNGRSTNCIWIHQRGPAADTFELWAAMKWINVGLTSG